MQNRIPKLADMLEQETVLVLGAGASVDYGFPLWEQLKTDFLNSLGNNSNNWIQLIEDNPDKTIDHILERASDEEILQFQTFVVIDFFKKESQIREFVGLDDQKLWVDHFAEKFVKDTDKIIGLAEKRISNFSVISLNYERNFESSFSNYLARFFNDRFPNHYIRNSHFGNKDYKQMKYSSIHPHGTIGILNEQHLSLASYDNSHSITFGNPENALLDHNIRRIYPVNLIKYINQPGPYFQANRKLATAKNIVVIGLSTNGILDSHLKFPETIDILFSGDEKIAENWHPLNLHAKELVKLL